MGPVQLVPFCTGLYRSVCLDKFKDFKGFRKVQWAGPFPKYYFVSKFQGFQDFTDIENFTRVGPFPKYFNVFQDFTDVKVFTWPFTFLKILRILKARGLSKS